MTQGELIASKAWDWLGTPHVNMAKVKGHGVDCGMLLIAVVEDARLIPKDSIHVKPYSNMWHLSHSNEWFVSTVEKFCDKVNDLQTGDFLLYRYGRCVSHGAIYVGNGMIIHAWVEHGVTLDALNAGELYDKKGRLRLYGIYRFNPDKARRELDGTV